MTTPSTSSRILPTIARILLGLPLLVFGLNGFLNFIPQPETPLPEKAQMFSAALVASGYMMPLALVLLAPFWVNSLAFHLFLERTGLIPAAVFAGLELYLAWCHRSAYRPLLTARYAP